MKWDLALGFAFCFLHKDHGPMSNAQGNQPPEQPVLDVLPAQVTSGSTRTRSGPSLLGKMFRWFFRAMLVFS